MEELNRRAFVRRNPENDRQIDVVKLPVEANYVDSSNFMQMRAKSNASGWIVLMSSVKSIEFVRARSPWQNVPKYDDAGSVVRVMCGGKTVYATPYDLTGAIIFSGLSPNTEYDVRLEMMDMFDSFQMAGNQYVTALSIPASMTFVGKCQDDSNLTAFCFESDTAVTALPANMFKDTSLKNLIIPAGMSISDGALECPGLSVKMTYSTYYQHTNMIDALSGISVDLAFMNEDSQIKQRSPVENRNVYELKLPASQLTEIQASAFARYSMLSSVVLPGSLMSIGEDAFAVCSGLTDCWMNDNSYDTLPARLFKKCSKLSSVKIPVNITRVNDEAFAECSSLTSITLSSSDDSSKLLGSNSERQFANCHSLQVLSLKSTLMGDSYYSNIEASDIFAGINHSLSIIFSSSSTSLTTDDAKNQIKQCCTLPEGNTLTLMRDNPGGAPDVLNVLKF